MVPLSCDNRLTGQTRKRILHGLMQGCVKALDAPFRRPCAPAAGRDVEPGKPAGKTPALDRIQPRQGGAGGKGSLAGARLPALQPEGERALCETVRWAERKFGDSGGHVGSRVSWPWKITKPPRILNGRYPFVKPFVKV